MLRYRVTNSEGRRVENVMPIGLVREFPKDKDARREADRLGVEFLGESPLLLDIRTASDAGTPIVAATVRQTEFKPAEAAGAASPVSKVDATVAGDTRFSTTSTPGRAVRGQKEIGKCSLCQAGASIASCRFIS